MDIPQLAKDTVTLVAPLLPYLIRAGTEAAKELGKGIGSAALGLGRTVWEKISGRASAPPALLDAAKELAAKPDDADLQAALRIQLRKLLEADASLAQELHAVHGDIVQQSQTLHVSGDGNLVNPGTIQGSTISISVKK